MASAFHIFTQYAAYSKLSLSFFFPYASVLDET